MLAWLADGMRGAVRSAFPLATLGVLAGLLFSPQGKDVLVALIEEAGTRHSVGGFVFLGVAATALSLSVWYSMRWLLTAHMPGLPLAQKVGRLRAALPRIAGFLAPALVSWSLATLTVTSSYASVRSVAIGSFAGLAIVLAVFYVRRSKIIKRLERRGWLSASARGPHGEPIALPPGAPTPPGTLRVIAWSVAGTLLVGLAVTLFPVTLPRVVGGAAVAALALASINLFGSFVLTYWPLRHGLPTLAPWLLVLAGVFGFWNDNHVIEPATSAVDAPDVDLKADFDAFLARADFNAYREAGAPVPVLFVASEGGGIRAAYWTAAVLSRLDTRVPALERHVYAVSGVSGGSLGLAAWLTAVRSARCSQTPGGAPTLPEPASVTAPLSMDFVSPAIAGIFYYDLAQRFIPVPIARFDRSRTMEEGWRRAFEGANDQPFAKTLAHFYSGCGEGLPHMLLNSTRVETGERVVLSRLPPYALMARSAAPLEACPDEKRAAAAGTPQATAIAQPPKRVFTATFDGMDPAFAARTQPLAGLVHHSARFPVVSPAGTVRRTTAGRPCDLAEFRLVDGGYFDNSGVQTTLELIDTLRGFGKPFRPVLLIVRNDASEAIAQESSGGLFPETSAVLGTLLAVRGAHAVLSRETAGRQLPDLDTIPLQVTKDSGAALAPLGWALSKAVRDAMDADADGVARNRADKLGRALQVSGGG